MKGVFKIQSYSQRFFNVDNLSTKTAIFYTVFVCLLTTYKIAQFLCFFVGIFCDLRIPKRRTVRPFFLRPDKQIYLNYA